MASRDTTLGYFSVMPPFENGHDCERHVDHEEKIKAAAAAAAVAKAAKANALSEKKPKGRKS